ncbi:hypothetical protein PQR02_03625 [Paraburkholderia sediminicola]|uniref:Uncharacterized protein n=1 Tax=Paraburkholderia rhynchosiae TaxID=487049 RepID=A0ACC7NCP9_9BURK
MKRELQALRIDGSTRIFGIVGSPVTQVKTPQLMNALVDAPECVRIRARA